MDTCPPSTAQKRGAVAGVTQVYRLTFNQGRVFSMNETSGTRCMKCDSEAYLGTARCALRRAFGGEVDHGSCWDQNFRVYIDRCAIDSMIASL